METESVDFMVTSPPYWGILNKQDQKVKKERVANNLDTKYSESDLDLGNVADYKEFLEILTEKVFMQCARILRKERYMAIVISDFRDKGEYISFHSDLIQKLNHHKIEGGGSLVLQGTKILIQNHKSLLPYGYPFSYVENIHHLLSSPVLQVSAKEHEGMDAFSEEVKKMIEMLSRFDRPMVCQEYLARTYGNTFEAVMPLLAVTVLYFVLAWLLRRLLNLALLKK